MYVGQGAISLKFSVSKAGNFRNVWPDQRLSICPTTTWIHYSPPSKKRTTKTTRCFVDDDHEVDKNDSYDGMSVHSRLIAVTAPSTPWALTRGDRYGSSGVLSIERPKMDMSQKSPSRRSTASPSVDDGGGMRKDGDDGGDIGGGSGNGGGGGVNDDDKYRFDDEDDDGDGDGDGIWLFGKRVLVEEIFDGITMNAVLSEWKQTMKDLPKGLRRACEMGLLSTAEITKFFWFNTRPTLSRLFVRLLPQGLSLDFYAKIMSDPALPWKLLLEAVSSVGWSLWLESTQGSDERKWDLVIANAATNAAFNTFLVFSLAPSSEFTRLRNLPNNVFEKSQRFHEFDKQKRAVSFFRKAVSLFALGFAAKSAAQIRLLINSSATTTDDNDHDRKIKKILKITSESCKDALAAGLSLGLLTNLRHQVIWGIDRRLDLHFDVKKVSLAFCLALRFLNVGIGTQSLNYWNMSDDHEVNHRMFRNIEDYSWLGLKNIILTSNKTQSTAPAKRKRVVKKKSES